MQDVRTRARHPIITAMRNYYPSLLSQSIRFGKLIVLWRQNLQNRSHRQANLDGREFELRPWHKQFQMLC